MMPKVFDKYLGSDSCSAKPRSLFAGRQRFFGREFLAARERKPLFLIIAVGVFEDSEDMAEGFVQFIIVAQVHRVLVLPVGTGGGVAIIE